MTHNEISPDDAARALSVVAERRRQVAGAVPFPTWYWPALGITMLICGVVADLPLSPELSGPAQVAVIALWGVMFCVAVFRQPVRPDLALVQLRGRLLVGAVLLGFVGAVVVAGFAVAQLLRLADAPLPGTFTGLFTGCLAIGGVLVQRVQQRIQMRFVR